MFLYPNRERWVFNISGRNNWINILNNSFIFSYYRFFNFFFNRWVVFKPLLLREINMSSKRFTKGGYYLRVKSIFSAKLVKSNSVHKRFNTINSSLIPDSLPSSSSQSSELRLILSKRSHMNSIVFFIKEPVQEVSSMD